MSGPCGTTLDAAHALSDVKTYYDNSTTLGQVPGAGDVTSVKALKDFNGAGSTAEWTAGTKVVYDTYGRVTSSTDALGRTTTTDYSPADTSLPTLVTVTNPKWKNQTTIDVARGIARSEFDPNNKVATQVHDGLGRLVQAWTPDHPKSLNPSTPNVQYTYNVSATAPSWVETQTLRVDLTYQPDFKIYDSLLQLREEQTTTADDTATARLISANFYDSLGRVTAADAPFFNGDADPGSTFVLPVDAQVPSETVTAYDGMGRATTSTQEYNAVAQATTTTTYPTGDEVDVDPPTGATPTATVTDARGQTTQVRQFHGTSPTGTYDATDYGYDAAGRQNLLTDSSGNSWTTSYDQLGDKVKTTDPDAGTTVYAYDDGKELLQTTDALHTPSGGVTASYDSVGRVTDTYAIPAKGGTPTHLTHTDYDPTGAIGQVAGTTSYDSAGRAWTTSVDGYTPDYLPTGSTTTVPASALGNSAPITYDVGTTYKAVTRNVETTSLPAIGPMAAENVGYGYDDNGLTVAMGGKDSYLSWMEYTHLGQPQRAHMGVTPNQIDETYNWEASTGRLLNDVLDMQSGTTHVDNTTYTYNPAGRITSISDVQDAGGTAKTDTQCFSYDYLQRLTEAWTDTGGTTTAPLPSIMGVGACTHTTPSAANLGGPDPYWQSFGYDATGNRTSETDHSPAGGTGQDTTTSESYPSSGATSVGPHQVSTVTFTGNGGGQQSFSYYPTGETKEITQAPGAKVLASGGTLASGQSMVSNSVRLTMQADGNLVLYALKSGQALWSSNTAGNPGAVATMGTDGNLSVHTSSGTTLWSSSSPSAGAYLRVQDDGQVSVVATDGSVVWHTSTASDDRSANDVVLTYDDDGRLATTTQTGPGGTNATTSYVYDASGNLIARTDTDNGTTTSTLFLGADQLTLDASGNPTADTRYYAVAGAPTAVRTATTGSSTTVLHFEAANQQGTGLTDITADNTSVTRRAYTPFGQDRTTGGNPATWPGDKGFVGGTPDDVTGLTNLGAREYDSTLGRFLSVDPVLDPTDPQSLNGYAYADNTPISASDPTGLMRDGGGDCGQTDSCNVGGHPASDCPPFCSPDGLAHGPSTGNGNNDSAPGSDLSTPKHKKHHHHSWVPGWVSDTVSTVADTADITRTYATAVVTNPRVLIGAGETAASLALMAVGAGGDEAGGLLCATVVGCIAGAPLAAASTAAVVGGAYGATHGAKDLGNGLHQAFNEASQSGGSESTVTPPKTGPGADLSNLTGSERARIQNATNRIKTPISVVGSRAAGEAGPESDWDYVITGVNSRVRHSVSSSLPKADITVGIGRQQDIFTGPLDESRPYITFYPN